MSNTTGTLRVLSYNIHHGAGMDRVIDLERIARTILSMSPDVVSLQEVDNNVRRSKRVDQTKELAELTGMTPVFGPSIPLGRGQYGNAVLTKLTVKQSEIIPLPGKELRSALCVTLGWSEEPSPGDLIFIATHFDLNKTARIASIPLIEKYVDSTRDFPAILAGDLNATPQSQTMLDLEKNWKTTTNSKGLFTFPAKKPTSQIDHILYRPSQAYTVLETRVLEEAMASDHRPIFTVLGIQRGGRYWLSHPPRFPQAEF